ncbi:MAG: hypothetical protein KIT80_04735 [Chitinophagaceae bacterium]|nr:hypothetical protein [Chitinophagaceae bacterium]MCW5926198.1 hypothetical protein [Chitinophagaceae bacterium]
MQQTKGPGKRGLFIFLWSNNLTTALAEKKYAVIREANTRQGIEELTNLGDEAFRRRNFNLIMVRKGRNVFTIKMNREAHAVTLKELTQTAEKIAEAIR